MAVIDMTGQKCGKLTVIKRVENNDKGQAMWLCQCECGNEVVVLGAKLRNGHTKSCGCLRKEIGAQTLEKMRQDKNKVSPNFIDLTGQVFGKLTVLNRNEKKKNNGLAYWNCLCECGNETVVSGTKLRSGKTKSCGCLHQFAKIKDLTGQQYGKLTVLSLDVDNPKKGAYWICQCECGKVISIPSKSLVHSHVQSCGCLNSKGEYKISQFFNNMNVEYIQQKTFEGLKGDKLPLRFDFYLPAYNICIEYQGLYHYEQKQHTEEDFLKQQRYDNLKRDYCQQNNIKLIEIPYWDFDKIDENYLMEKIKEENINDKD